MTTAGAICLITSINDNDNSVLDFLDLTVSIFKFKRMKPFKRMKQFPGKLYELLTIQ